MSKYKRDDQKFREQIAALADAGLKFPTAPAKLPEYTLHFDEMEHGLIGAPGSLGPGTGRKSALFNGVPAYVRTIEPPVRKTNFGFNLPGLVAGLVWWSPFAAIGIVLIHWLLGGAR